MLYNECTGIILSFRDIGTFKDLRMYKSHHQQPYTQKNHTPKKHTKSTSRQARQKLL